MLCRRYPVGGGHHSDVEVGWVEVESSERDDRTLQPVERTYLVLDRGTSLPKVTRCSGSAFGFRVFEWKNWNLPKFDHGRFDWDWVYKARSLLSALVFVPTTSFATNFGFRAIRKQRCPKVRSPRLSRWSTIWSTERKSRWLPHVRHVSMRARHVIKRKRMSVNQANRLATDARA